MHAHVQNVRKCILQSGCLHLKHPFCLFCVQNSHKCTCSATYLQAEMEFYALLAFLEMK